MYFISLGIVLIYCSLFVCSFYIKSSENFFEKRKGITGIFDRIAFAAICIVANAGAILGKIFSRNGQKSKASRNFGKYDSKDSQVSKYLQNLNPGEQIEKIRANYFIRKLSLSLLVLLSGTLLGAGIKYSSESESEKITEDGSLARNDYNGDTKNVTMLVTSEDNEETVEVSISPRSLTYSEIEEILPDFYTELESILLGENEKAGEIHLDLNPVSEISGYPFSVTWTTSDYELISPGTGKVSEVTEECKAVMTAYIKYLDYSFEKDFELTIVPKKMSESEKYSGELEKMITSSEEESREVLLWKLPDKLNGKNLSWKVVVNDNSLLIWMLISVVSVCIFFISDMDLRKKVNEKKLKMKGEYSEIVRKLALYIGAGMTVRNAFNKIATDAVSVKKINPVYGEMMFTCRELRSGVSEEEAYEKFGRRTGVQEYIRIGTLLQQNLKKGSSNLTLRLCEEADNATMERLQNCRKDGEEAGTKLLVPMVLLLLVVMVMIMFPAFSSMQL